VRNKVLEYAFVIAIMINRECIILTGHNQVLLMYAYRKRERERERGSWLGDSPHQPAWPSWQLVRDLLIPAVQRGLRPGYPVDVHGKGERENQASVKSTIPHYISTAD